jgi:hypothetical protein
MWLGPDPCTSATELPYSVVAACNPGCIWPLQNLAVSSNIIRPRHACGVAWPREADSHIPPLLTPASLISTRAGNDFSTLYAPLIRNGRMEQFYWKPNRQDLLAILLQMYKVGTPLVQSLLL